MKSHIETCIITSEVPEVFNLVADIESYPEFLPWCAGARITKTISERDKKRLMADLIIAFGSFREKFPSKIVLNEKESTIEIFSSDKPFKVLHGKWCFQKVNSDCHVSFEIKFEFKSKILDKLMGVFFYKAVKQIVKAFQKRVMDLKRHTPLT